MLRYPKYSNTLILYETYKEVYCVKNRNIILLYKIRDIICYDVIEKKVVHCNFKKSFEIRLQKD